MADKAAVTTDAAPEGLAPAQHADPRYVTLTKDVDGVGKQGQIVCASCTRAQQLADAGEGGPVSPEQLDLAGEAFIFLPD